MAKAYQERLITLVRDTLSLLCKNGLEYSQEFAIEGLLGVTLDKNEVFLIPVKELVADKGVGTTEDAENATEISQDDEPRSPKRERKKKRRHTEPNHNNDDSSHARIDERTNDPAYSTPDYESTPKRSRNVDLAEVKSEDIVVIKEEVDDDDITAFQDNTIDDNNFTNDTGDPNMPYFSGDMSQPDMNFSMDQLAGGSGLQGAMSGPEGESWLQESPGDLSQRPGDWQGQKHQAECPMCQKMFFGAFEMRRHYKTVHLKERYNCDMCQRSYSRVTSLKYHRLEVHGVGTDPTVHTNATVQMDPPAQMDPAAQINPIIQMPATQPAEHTARFGDENMPLVVS